VVIDHGRKLFQGPTSELIADGDAALVIGCQSAVDLAKLEALLTRRGLRCTRDRDRLNVNLAISGGDVNETVADISRIASAEQLTLIELTVTKANLEERYLNLISGAIQS
jgi:hypothetical protein